MESSKKFEVSDMVEAYKQFIGYITYIDRKNDTADVEWEEEDGWNSTSIPLKYLKKVEI
jgi:hypothetical protein